MPSDFAMELLQGMIEVGAIDRSSAVRSADLLSALDIQDLDGCASWIRELLGDGYLIRVPPNSIRETVRYYVSLERLSNALSEDHLREQASNFTDRRKSDILAVLSECEDRLNKSNLPQDKRAQAGAIISSVRILIEAPDPPKKIIRDLLYDLAAIATIFAVALQMAQSLS